MDHQQEPTLRDLVALIRRGVVFALLVAVGAGLLTYLLTKRATPTYDATVTVLASQPDTSLQSFNVSLVTAPSLDASAYRAAATSTPVLTQALQKIDQTSPSQSAIESLQKRLSVRTESNPKSSLINLTVASTDPKWAADSANAIAYALLAWDKQRASNNLATIVDTLKGQIKSLDAQISQATNGRASEAPRVTALQQVRAQQELQLTAAEALQTSAVGDLEILQPATIPTEPSAPHPSKSAALAFVVGIFLVYGLLFLRDALDTRFRTSEDLARDTHLPVLAEFPRVQGGARRLPREAANFLRTNVLFATTQDHPRVLLVTSSGGADGKTSVAISLAESFARSDYRTLLVDTDLRRPVTAREYNLNMLVHTPLQSYLEDPKLSFEPARVSVGDNVLDVVPTFKAAPSPTELLSHGFGDFLARVRNDYDVIVVDSAPVMPVADTLAVAPQFTGVIFVVSLSAADRRTTAGALGLLTRIGARVLGVVATNLDNKGTDASAYGYGYGLGEGHGLHGRDVGPATANAPQLKAPPRTLRAATPDRSTKHD